MAFDYLQLPMNRLNYRIGKIRYQVKTIQKNLKTVQSPRREHGLLNALEYQSKALRRVEAAKQLKEGIESGAVMNASDALRLLYIAQGLPLPGLLE